MVAMISYSPMLLFGLFSGILVDTFDRRQIMIVSDVLRAFIVLILPITFFTGSINLGVILLVSFALATFSTLFNPARDSLLPELVKNHRLVRANSLIQISTYSAILIGPALGGRLDWGSWYCPSILSRCIDFLIVLFCHSTDPVPY